ncbi:terminase small subunit [Dryocola sp. LX212]
MLTGQKKKYADALKEGMKQREAAIHAGYSEKTAKVKGSQLAKDPDVVAYLSRIATDKKVNSSVNQGAERNLPASEGGSDELPDPLKVMARIMQDNITSDPKLALEAAAKLAPYVSQKKGVPGKKEARNAAAKSAMKKFGSMAPPKLVVNNKG